MIVRTAIAATTALAAGTMIHVYTFLPRPNRRPNEGLRDSSTRA
jgi:hypothetical protein